MVGNYGAKVYIAYSIGNNLSQKFSVLRHLRIIYATVCRSSVAHIVTDRNKGSQLTFMTVGFSMTGTDLVL